MLIRRPGQAWHALQPALHDERALQTLLVQSPGLLPSFGTGELALAPNFRAGSTGSVDLLGVGVDGRIVLVECGRQEGPGRRPVGGAALAVAAALWRAPYEEFDRAFATRAGVSLAERVATVAKAGGVPFDEAGLQAAVAANLATGRFQLILAVDNISEEVRRVVAYLNSGARAGLTAMALGLRYLAEEGVEILFPTVYRGDAVPAESFPLLAQAPTVAPAAAPRAHTPAPAPGAAPAHAAAPAPAPAAAPAPASAPAPIPAAAASAAVAPAPAPTAPAPTPAPASAPAPAPAASHAAAPAPTPPAPAPAAAQGELALFSALAAACLPQAVDSVRRLYQVARDKGRELQWGQGEHPAVTAVFEVGGRPVGVWSCYTDLKPSFVINFEWLAPHVPPERLQRLAARLGQLSSVPERLTGLAEAGYRRRLALAVNAVLAQPGAADVIASALDELLEPAGAVTAGASAAPPQASGGRPASR